MITYRMHRLGQAQRCSRECQGPGCSSGPRRFKLAADGGLGADLVTFKQHKTKYIFATEAGIAERRYVASNVTPAKLRALRRAPSLHANWSKMQILFEAGILVCPTSGMPVFNTSEAPKSLWPFLRALQDALNTPSDEAGRKAAMAAKTLSSHLGDGVLKP